MGQGVEEVGVEEVGRGGEVGRGWGRGFSWREMGWVRNF